MAIPDLDKRIEAVARNMASLATGLEQNWLSFEEDARQAIQAAFPEAFLGGLCCYDCGRPYEKGPDLVVSDEDWQRIAPGNKPALLCPNCMNDRFEALGVEPGSIKATFRSGPFAHLVKQSEGG